MDYINEYANKTDEEIISIIQAGNKKALEFLINKYHDLVKSKSSRFFMYGADQNDVLQEGMIGLYLAIKNYNPNNDTSFRTFANLCIERQLISAIKTANRQKHTLLNTAISINATFEEDEDSQEIIGFLKSYQSEDPSEIIANTEYYKNINLAIEKSLSNRELEVLKEYKNGKSYAEIAQKLDCKTKSVDTALTRIRKKAIKIRKEFDEAE